ncbi:S-layer homology domain-containing protein [Paenibacillus sp. An7]|uniref:S-layer homology domain-containing protein n=1 Tax=Paenibacillus sp. An7 TaxID=2689577 RepID=UPI0013575C64|nr:S-layer homology domain-containing protein [Paenibacillus sp. An7]
MQRIKRPMVWLLLVSLVISLFPPGLVSRAEAADNVATSFFTPDIVSLKNTVKLKLESGTNQITRENVHQVTDSNLLVTGTYTKVTGSTLSAKVQQLTWDPTNKKWIRESSKVSPGVIQLDLDKPDNRYSSTLTLYPGMNEITFSGNQGSLTRSETFYVLFDQVPYVESLKVLGLSEPIILNEGTQVVVPKKEITLEGKIQNATKATVALNGGTALSTTLLSDGTFYSPQLQLNAGVNKITLVITNGSDKVTVEHSLYYYDENNPIVAMYLANGTESAQNMLSGKPTWTGTEGTATIYVQALVPDKGDSAVKNVFFDNELVTSAVFYSSMLLEDTGNLKLTGSKDIIIPGNSESETSYRLITFAIPKFAFKKQDETVLRDQSHSVRLELGSETNGTYIASKAANFTYAENQTVINQLYYLKGYETSSTSYSKENLNEVKVDSSEFYISVKTNSKVKNPKTLVAKYLPIGDTVKLTYVKSISTTEYIYKITGFQNGNQTLRFQYSDSSQYKDALISFISKTYIYVANLTDGQTVTIDSNSAASLLIEGEYIGFDLANSINQIFVNGEKQAGLPSFYDKGKFEFTLDVSAKNGPLVYGENRIVFTGTVNSNNNQIREISKEIRIYILDKNVSNISSFQPAVTKDRVRFPDTFEESADKQWSQIFNLTPEFIYNNEKYTTSLDTHDLIIRGNGATDIDLKLGSASIFKLNIPVNVESRNHKNEDGYDYYYDFYGDQTDFAIRIKDIPLTQAGTYVYNLELTNSTGAKTSQQIELVREVKPYRLLAPQATVDGAYVVNKNFVRFDIEAKGAKQVLINKVPAILRSDLGEDRFLLDYVGLKQDKANTIKIDIITGSTTISDTISVYYTGTVGVDSQYMAPKVSNKYSVFNKSVELEFPKGTIMQSTTAKGITKFYPNTQLLFGIADSKDGVVERKNDYGNIIGFPSTGLTEEETGIPNWSIPDVYLQRFSSDLLTRNFTPVSNVYWINGGIGEQGDLGTSSYLPPTNGLAPYSIEGLFGDPTTSSERKIIPSQRGELTITYNNSVVDEVGSTITVYKYNSNREWINVGGVVDTKKHTVTVPFDEFGYYVVMKQSRSFTDITNHNWARNILNAMYSKGLMNNLRNDLFGTDDRTSRGEFATLLVKGLNIPLNYNNKQTFTDVNPGSKDLTWDYAHIETATRAGIVTGLTEGVFGPSQPLTREQAAVMIARAMKLKLPVNDSKLTDNLAKMYVDAGSINTYARPAVYAVNKAKIMQGNPITLPGQTKPQYNFSANGFLTRAEAAKIAVELFKKTTKLFPANLS